MREFSTGATRDTDEGKHDYRGFISPQALKRFGEYMTKHRKQVDGKLRDSDNWKKGIPQQAYLSSLIRHVVDLHYTLESQVATPTKVVDDLLCAVWFNVQGLLHERLQGRDVEVKPVVSIPVKGEPLKPERFLDVAAPVLLDWGTWLRRRDETHFPICSSMKPEYCIYHKEYLRYVSGVTK